MRFCTQLRLHQVRLVLAVTLLAGAGLGASAAPAPATPALPTIEFTRPVFTERATAPTALILLRRSGDVKAGASVEISTSNGTAQAELDYVPRSGPILFAPGQVEQKAAIQLLKNLNAQGNRTVKLVLGNPVDARLGVLDAAELVIAEAEGMKHPWMAFGLDRISWLTFSVLDIPFWQYLVSLIYIFLAFFFSKLIDFIIRERLRHWTRKTKTGLDDLLLNLLRAPLKVIVFVILLHLGLRIFLWPDWIASFISKSLYVVVAVSVTWMGLKFIDLVTTYWKQRSAEEDKAFAEQLLPIIRNTLKVFTLVVAILLTLQNLGLNITSLITSLGIGGLALALAAQDTLGNFFGAIVILIDKPFRIGDEVQFDSISGKIESIGFRSTRLRNANGHLVSIPNRTIGNATIINITKRPNLRTVINMALAADTPADKVQRAIALLEEIFGSQPMTEKITISFDKFAGSAPNLAITHWCKAQAAGLYQKEMQQVNLAIKQRFEEEGIRFTIST